MDGGRAGVKVDSAAARLTKSPKRPKQDRSMLTNDRVARNDGRGNVKLRLENRLIHVNIGRSYCFASLQGGCLPVAMLEALLPKWQGRRGRPEIRENRVTKQDIPPTSACLVPTYSASFLPHVVTYGGTS
jgi:hypothetical protein